MPRLPRPLAPLALLLAATTAPAGAAAAQQPAVRPSPAAAAAVADTILLVGTVRATNGAALVGAEVTLTPAGPGPVLVRRAYSDEEGRFRVPQLAPGRATLAVRRLGFRPETRPVELPATGTVVTLAPIPQTLATVVVKARGSTLPEGRLRDFERRRAMGNGRFFTQADIDRRNPLRTTDVLRMVPGLRMASDVFGRQTLRFRNNACDPLVWIDGMPAYTGYLDVDVFPPNSLGAIEVYSGVATVPVELRGPRGEGSCGVIALWSRMPEPRPRGKRITAEQLAALLDSATVYTAEQVSRPARMDEDYPLEPLFPDSLRSARVSGEAIVEFVVGADGRVEPETVGLVAATHVAFGNAALVAAPRSRYVPAEREGRRVRQLVQQIVRFDPTR